VRELALLAVLAGCGSSSDTAAIDRAARSTFALGAACCDDGRYERVEPSPGVTDPDAIAMVAAGVIVYRPRAPVDVELCGVQTRSDAVTLNVFRDRLAQALLSCSGGGCPGTDCAALVRACNAKLGEPATLRRDGDTEYVRYQTPSTFLRIVRSGAGVCELALQDAPGVIALEAAMARAKPR
jgi:hypothetical protein